MKSCFVLIAILVFVLFVPFINNGQVFHPAKTKLNKGAKVKTESSSASVSKSTKKTTSAKLPEANYVAELKQADKDFADNFYDYALKKYLKNRSI